MKLTGHIVHEAQKAVKPSGRPDVNKYIYDILAKKLLICNKLGINYLSSEIFTSASTVTEGASPVYTQYLYRKKFHETAIAIVPKRTIL